MGVVNEDQFDRTEEWAHGSHLFDPAPFDTPKVERDPATMHPGDLTHEEWIQRPDVVFHGTFRHKDPNSSVAPPTIHAGTLQSAQERMQMVHRLMGLGSSSLRERKPAIGETSPIGSTFKRQRHLDENFAARYAGLNDAPQGYIWDKDAPVFDENGRLDSRKARSHVVDRELTHGVVMGRRISETFPARIGDAHANAADRDYLDELGDEASFTVRDSVGDDDEAFSLAPVDRHTSTAEYERLHPQYGLERGYPLPYRNGNEDTGSTSYVIPKGSSTGYWDDFLASPNRSDEEKAHVRRMQEELGSPPVPFIVRAAKDTGVQGKLFKEYPVLNEEGDDIVRMRAEPNFDQSHAAGFAERTVTHVARPVFAPEEPETRERAKVGRGGVKKEPPLKGKFGDDGGLPGYLGI